jgi:hypothetical protein
MIGRQRWMGIPLARRRNRRGCVALYWLMVASVCTLLAWIGSKNGNPLVFDNPTWFYAAAVALTGILGGLGRNGLIRLFPRARQVPDDYSFMTSEDIAAKKKQLKTDQWDERETTALQRYQSRAYSIVRLGSYPALCALIVLDLPATAKYTFPREPLLWLLLVVLWSLPQTLILWTESDMESPNAS